MTKIEEQELERKKARSLLNGPPTNDVVIVILGFVVLVFFLWAFGK